MRPRSAESNDSGARPVGASELVVHEIEVRVGFAVQDVVDSTEMKVKRATSGRPSVENGNPVRVVHRDQRHPAIELLDKAAEGFDRERPHFTSDFATTDSHSHMLWGFRRIHSGYAIRHPTLSRFLCDRRMLLRWCDFSPALGGGEIGN
jgi:hypothetical protein